MSLCLTKGCPCCDNAFFNHKFQESCCTLSCICLVMHLAKLSLGKGSPLSDSAGKWPANLWWCLQEVWSCSLITSASPAEANESVHADSATDARSVVDHFSSSKKNGSERSFQIDSFPVEPFVFCLAQWMDPLWIYLYVMGEKCQ